MPPPTKRSGCREETGDDVGRLRDRADDVKNRCQTLQVEFTRSLLLQSVRCIWVDEFNLSTFHITFSLAGFVPTIDDH